MNAILVLTDWTLKSFVAGDFMQTFGIFLAAVLTFAIFSFLYKDNAIYKFAEHLLIGVSLGYWVVYLFDNAFIPYVYNPLEELFGNFSGAAFFRTMDTIVFILVGILFFAVIFPKYRWLVRFPIAIQLGVASGYAIPVTINANIIEQMKPSVLPLWASGMTWWGTVSAVLILVGILSALLYFYFSIKHEGPIKHISKLGRYYLMIGFGASFGLTVMGRISLLIERFNFLINDWIGMIISWF